MKPVYRLLALAAIMAAASLAGAQELTFNLGNSATVLDLAQDSLILEGRLNASLDLPLDASHRFQVQAGALYNLDALAADPSGGMQAIEFFFLQQFKLGGQVAAADPAVKGIAWEIGRMYMDDPSRQIYAGNYDGLRFSTQFAFGSIDAGIGTTMLLGKRENSILLSLADLKTAADNLDTLASARIFGSLSGTVNLGSGHVLKPFVAFQEDANELKGYNTVTPGTTAYSGEDGAALDSQYVGLSFGGSIGPRITHESSLIIEFGRTLSWLADATSGTGASYQWTPVYAGLGMTTWNFSLEELLDSTLSTSLFVGTGDSDAGSYYEGNTSGDFNQFFSLVPYQYSQILTAASGNMAAWNVAWTIRPWKNDPAYMLQTLSGTLSMATLFRSSTGALPLEGLASGSANLYLGQEFGLAATWRPANDLRLNLGVGAFIPASGALGAFDTSYVTANPVLLKAKLGLNLYF